MSLQVIGCWKGEEPSSPLVHRRRLDGMGKIRPWEVQETPSGRHRICITILRINMQVTYQKAVEKLHQDRGGWGISVGWYKPGTYLTVHKCAGLVRRLENSWIYCAPSEGNNLQGLRPKLPIRDAWKRHLAYGFVLFNLQFLPFLVWGRTI